MSTPAGFLNTNAARAFPFLSGAFAAPEAGDLAALPTETVLDFGAEVLVAGFLPATHRVFLSEIRRVGTSYWFVFRTDCPALAGLPLVFLREPDAAPYAASFSDADVSDEDIGPVSASFPSASEGVTCPGQAPWRGYLVTGPMAGLAALLPAPGVLAGVADVEPCLVSVDSDRVDRVELVDDEPTAFTAPPECGGPSEAPETATSVVASCLQGDLVLAPGYNAVVTASARAGSLTVAGPDDAAARCDEVLRTVNGVPGPRVWLRAGPGVEVVADADANEVVVRIATHLPPNCDSASESA